uniref:Uncharacterized protein n=1 Tax=Candidatus Kentrum sp. MB TaxID=2138164 RepID=A0A451B9P1_9GAMM|nr:MAG: hypothetical protein BECKMB1821I_GA0114274_10132 [Candidatus Kentron sp. MB]VFK75008.1 MAG: hypothetical protein BECKMB1821H_GA0114242_10143 [Candidatus Kentron sp. MB]
MRLIEESRYPMDEPRIDKSGVETSLCGNRSYAYLETINVCFRAGDMQLHIPAYRDQRF